MTEVVINTEDISEEKNAIIDDTAARVERLEMADNADTFEKAIRDDEIATRLRALEVRMEHQQAAALAPDETVAVDPEPVAEPAAEPASEPDLEEEPETVEEDPEEVPEEVTPDDPTVDIPSDPTERPELNPQGVADTLKEIAADKPKTRAKKPPEKRPTTQRTWKDAVLGGSGGAKRGKKKAKASK